MRNLDTRIPRFLNNRGNYEGRYEETLQRYIKGRWGGKTKIRLTRKHEFLYEHDTFSEERREVGELGGRNVDVWNSWPVKPCPRETVFRSIGFTRTFFHLTIKVLRSWWRRMIPVAIRWN